MLYYLGYYNCEQIAAEYRKAPPPAMNKMNYIISVLSDIAPGKVMVVSPCETTAYQYIKGSIHEINNGIALKTFDSFQSKYKILRGIGHKWTKTQLFLFLLKHIKSEDTILVYHSLPLIKIIKWIRAIKGCKLVIEVEELYSDVREDSNLRRKEINYLRLADQYIMITELLNKEVNQLNKPAIISHGTYRTNPKYCEKRSDGKIHVVYAGSFNPIKGGALAAIEAAKYLDEKYVLHILGKGSPTDTESVCQRINQMKLLSNCQIIYEGYKTGIDFDRFIQSCHIGLSTQQPDGKYNASSFPSKILMYMSNGLSVVSVRIPAVESSLIGEFVYYYDEPIPQKIAQAVKEVSVEFPVQICEKLAMLDNTFHSDLSNMFETRD